MCNIYIYIYIYIYISCVCTQLTNYVCTHIQVRASCPNPGATPAAMFDVANLSSDAFGMPVIFCNLRDLNIWVMAGHDANFIRFDRAISSRMLEVLAKDDYLKDGPFGNRSLMRKHSRSIVDSLKSAYDGMYVCMWEDS